MILHPLIHTNFINLSSIFSQKHCEFHPRHDALSRKVTHSLRQTSHMSICSNNGTVYQPSTPYRTLQSCLSPINPLLESSSFQLLMKVKLVKQLGEPTAREFILHSMFTKRFYFVATHRNLSGRFVVLAITEKTVL